LNSVQRAETIISSGVCHQPLRYCSASSAASPSYTTYVATQAVVARTRVGASALILDSVLMLDQRANSRTHGERQPFVPRTTRRRARTTVTGPYANPFNLSGVPILRWSK